MAKRILTLEEMGEATYQINSGTALSEVASTYGITEKAFGEQYNQYWDRWHQLREIKQKGDFSSEESTEYSTIEKTVKRMDEREAARCRKATEPFRKEHGKRIASLHRLSKALEKSIEGQK